VRLPLEFPFKGKRKESASDQGGKKLLIRRNSYVWPKKRTTGNTQRKIAIPFLSRKRKFLSGGGIARKKGGKKNQNSTGCRSIRGVGVTAPWGGEKTH